MLGNNCENSINPFKLSYAMPKPEKVVTVPIRFVQ